VFALQAAARNLLQQHLWQEHSQLQELQQICSSSGKHVDYCQQQQYKFML
jgi:hypothetical protein